MGTQYSQYYSLFPQNPQYSSLSQNLKQNPQCSLLSQNLRQNPRNLQYQLFQRSLPPHLDSKGQESQRQHIAHKLSEDSFASNKKRGELSHIDKQLLELSDIGRVEEVQNLLKDRGNPNVQDAKGETPLHKAALKGHILVMELLLQAKANPYAVTLNGETPMSYAIKKSHFYAVKTLVEFGYKVNHPCDLEHKPPLAIACAYQHVDIAKYLLARKALITDKAIFIVKKLPVKELSRDELKTMESAVQLEENVLVPHKESIQTLIRAGADTSKILDIIVKRDDHYFITGKMTSHIWSEFSTIEAQLSRMQKGAEGIIRKPRIRQKKKAMISQLET